MSGVRRQEGTTRWWLSKLCFIVCPFVGCLPCSFSSSKSQSRHFSSQWTGLWTIWPASNSVIVSEYTNYWISLNCICNCFYELLNKSISPLSFFKVRMIGSFQAGILLFLLLPFIFQKKPCSALNHLVTPSPVLNHPL